MSIPDDDLDDYPIDYFDSVDGPWSLKKITYYWNFTDNSHFHADIEGVKKKKYSYPQGHNFPILAHGRSGKFGHVKKHKDASFEYETMYDEIEDGRKIETFLDQSGIAGLGIQEPMEEPVRY